MSTASSRRTLMLIDDSEPARELVYWSLGGPSSLFDIVSVPDPFEGLEALKSTAVDLVISDYHMPGMNGADLIHALATDAATAEIPVIIMSADNDYRIEQAAREAGAVNFLVKPFTPTELLNAIDAALGGAQATDRLASGQMTIQTLLESIPHLAMILDENHRVIMANRAFFTLSKLGVSDCPLVCSSIHGDLGEPPTCPLTEAARTGGSCERIVHDAALGDLLVSVYPLDITTEDGRRLFFHVARPAEDS